MGKVILGTKESKTKVDGKEKIVTETVACNIPDEPEEVSDFPVKAVAAIGKPGADGLVNVVTVDGQKFRVKDDRKKGSAAPASQATA